MELKDEIKLVFSNDFKDATEHLKKEDIMRKLVDYFLQDIDKSDTIEESLAKIEAHITELKERVATETTLGSVKIPEIGGLIVSGEGNLYVRKSDNHLEDKENVLATTKATKNLYDDLLSYINTSLPKQINQVKIIDPTASTYTICQKINELIAELKNSGMMK